MVLLLILLAASKLWTSKKYVEAHTWQLGIVLICFCPSYKGEGEKTGSVVWQQTSKREGKRIKSKVSTTSCLKAQEENKQNAEGIVQTEKGGHELEGRSKESRKDKLTGTENWREKNRAVFGKIKSLKDSCRWNLFFSKLLPELLLLNEKA